MFAIEPDKPFPHLPRAPIVEAVLHWQAAASIELEENSLKEHLAAAFPDYDLTLQHNIEAALSGSSQGVEFRHSAAWEGFRLTKTESGEPLNICQFKKDGVVFSRLAPYPNWEAFSREALRFWEVFVKLAKPTEISRLSTRFISQIAINDINEIHDFLVGTTEPLVGIDIVSDSFFHQDTLNLGSLPYAANVIRAVQAKQTPGSNGKTLIVDIAVSTADAVAKFAKLPRILEELRFIKNKLFFTVMKDAEKKFGKENA